jgi:hypothetical protein
MQQNHKSINAHDYTVQRTPSRAAVLQRGHFFGFYIRFLIE